MSDAAVIEEFLRALRAQDWDAFSATLAEDGIARVGPYMDVITSREDYIAFLRPVMPRLTNYQLEVHRISPIGPNRFLVEMDENLEVDGVMMPGPQADIFELNDAGRICGVSIFKKTPGGKPTLPGIDANDRTAGGR